MVNIKIELTEPLKKMFQIDLLKNNHIRFVFRDQLEKIVQLSRRKHKYISRTGKLDQSIEQELLSNDKLQGRVRINDDVAKYGKYQHNGTMEHKIPLVNKKALRFVQGGMFMFSKGHMVKGITKDPFLENAINERLPDIRTALNSAIISEMRK